MDRFVAWVRRFAEELRRRRVIRVAVVYAGTAFVILQLGEILVDPFDLPGWTLRLITLVLILGFPLAVGLAWVFDVTEEGLVRTGAETEAAGEMGLGGKPLTSNGLIVGLLAVAIGLLLYPRVFSTGGNSSGQPSVQRASADTAQVEKRSIAVLPFSNLSGQKEARSLTRGLHDDLMTRLSNVGDLSVNSRRSVEKYRDTDLALPVIADTLGVRWIVEGGVQRSEDRVKINAQLIDPRSDAYRWASTYERDLSAENVFAIQGEIAGEIAEALEATLTAGEQERIAGAPTQNLEAYRYYVEGRQRLAQSLSQDELVRAAWYFGRALEQDSTYALAWAGLADALAKGFVDQGLDSGSIPDSLVLPEVTSMQAARRALEINPDLAEAHASLGAVHYEQRNAPEALRSFQRAVELKPSYAQAHNGLAQVYTVLGRREKALEHLKLAEDLNPNHVSARHSLFDAYNAVGQPKKALKEAREQQRQHPYPAAVWGEARALSRMGRHEEAIQLAEKRLEATDSKGERVVLRSHLITFEAAAGDTARAREHLEALKEISLSQEERARTAFLYGAAHWTLGNVDASIEEFRRQSDWWKVPTIGLRETAERRPSFAEDPRYKKLVREVNEYWGLNPDGTIPEDTGVSSPSASDSDA